MHFYAMNTKRGRTLDVVKVEFHFLRVCIGGRSSRLGKRKLFQGGRICTLGCTPHQPNVYIKLHQMVH